jgi:hypothetical protein
MASLPPGKNGPETAVVARRLTGESMAELCREFVISRKTGCKIFDPYKDVAFKG